MRPLCLSLLLASFAQGCPAPEADGEQSPLEYWGVDPGDLYDEYGDGEDVNGDGVDGHDADGDSYPAPDFGVPDELIDCDDDEPLTHPGADDLPRDGIDQDCDGLDITVDRRVFEARADDGTEEYGDLPVVYDTPTDELPYSPSIAQDLGLLTSPPRFTTAIVGSIDALGDVDTYRFVSTGGSVFVELSWPEAADRLSPGLLCFHEDEWNEPGYYYLLEGSEFDQQPGGSWTLAPLVPDADCFLFLISIEGGPADYTIHLTPGEDG